MIKKSGKKEAKQQSHFRDVIVPQMSYSSTNFLLSILQPSIRWNYLPLCLQLLLKLLCKGLYLQSGPLSSSSQSVRNYPLDISSWMSHCSPKLNRLPQCYSEHLLFLLDSSSYTPAPLSCSPRTIGPKSYQVCLCNLHQPCPLHLISIRHHTIQSRLWSSSARGC